MCRAGRYTLLSHSLKKDLPIGNCMINVDFSSVGWKALNKASNFTSLFDLLEHLFDNKS